MLKLSSADLKERVSSRAKSGIALPRGFQKVDFIEVVLPAADEPSAPETADFTLD